MSTTAKRQHYVPRFYLDRWRTPGKAFLYVYDKQEDRVFTSTPSRVAAESEFYSDARGAQKEERAIAALERTFAPAIKTLVESEDLSALRPEDQKALDWMFCLQMVRTKSDRVAKDHFLTAMREEMGPSSVEELRLEMESLDAKEMHLGTMADTGKLVEHFSKLSYCLQVNGTSRPFTTSDNPVFAWNRFKDPTGLSSGRGVTSYGVTFEMTLSPDISLIALDSRPWRDGIVPRKLRATNDENIDWQRTAMCTTSMRFIYSTTADFAIEREFLEDAPEYRDPHRTRNSMIWSGVDILAKHAEASNYPPRQAWTCPSCGEGRTSCGCTPLGSIKSRMGESPGSGTKS